MWLLVVQVSLTVEYDVCTSWIYYVTSMCGDIKGRGKNEVQFFREKLTYSIAESCVVAMNYIEL